MKKTILSVAVAGVVILSAFKGAKHEVVYKVDTKLSSMEWYAEKVNGKHNGVVALTKGEITDSHGVLAGVFEVDMNTIETKDMTGKYATDLDNHLKNEDFFSVVKHPTAKFVSTSITPIKEAKQGSYTHTIKGTLTIKDKTNELTFDAIIKTEGNKIACVGSAMVDRSKYDIKYGSKTFFPEIGDKMINDEFRIQFNVVAVK